MVAEFYIIAESFSQNLNFTKEEIEDKTRSLASDFIEIRKYRETNKLFVHPNIYYIHFINNITISDLLYNDEIANKNLDRDVRNLLKKIIIESQNTDLTTDEVKEVLLPEHNENLCHGLIGFNLIEGINPEFQVVYNIKGWFEFRRHYLKVYPKNEIYFIEECKKYFPNLFFHERNKATVHTIFHNCTQKIVYHLTALNDKFRESQLAGLNRSEVLKRFSIAAQLDETASLEGNPLQKQALTFPFINSSKRMEYICCEPHLKLCHNDNYPGDNSYSTDRRIYFHEGKTNIQDGKILIGHIGDHL